jgi:hypothetical protein
VIYLVPVAVFIYGLICFLISDASILRILSQSILRGKKRKNNPELSSPSELDEEAPKKDSNSERSEKIQVSLPVNKPGRDKPKEVIYPGIKINMVQQKPSKDMRIRVSKGNELIPKNEDSERQISLTAKTKQRKMQLANSYAQQQVKNSSSKPSTSPLKPDLVVTKPKRIEPFQPVSRNAGSNLQHFLSPENDSPNFISSRKSSTSSRENLRSKSR